MKILALDSSGSTASAAILDDYITLAEASCTSAKKHTETLLPMVDGLFSVTGISPQQLDYIAVTSGPGSFTGLRIAAAAAKGLAFGLGKQIIAVPTLDAMAYTVSAYGTWLLPMLDARRGQVYSALYKADEPLNVQRVTDYLALPLDEMRQLTATFSNKPLEIHDRLHAEFVGSAALTMLENGQVTPSDELPLLYIRKPQAEREREAKCSSQT